MPAAAEYLPDDKDQRSAAEAELTVRARLLATHRDYYFGRHKSPLKVRDGSADRVVINECRKVVDRRISFANPSPPRLELAENETTDDELYLTATWKDNDDVVLLSNMMLDGALSGQVYARVIALEPYPRIAIIDPAAVITTWDANSYDKILWHEIYWTAQKKDYREDVVSEGNHWVFHVWTKNQNRWEQSGEDVIWPSKYCPIVTWQHFPDPHSFYGIHELQHAELNDSINKGASDVKRILRYYSDPRSIGTGFEAKTIQETSIGNFWTIPNPDAKVFNLEMQSDLGSSMRFLDLLISSFLEESRVILLSGGPEAFRGMTNLAIRATFMDMIAANETIHRTYTKGIQKISQLILESSGRKADVVPSVYWGSALPVDQREELELVRQQISLGLMSKRTASARLGLDFEKEQERIIDESLTSDILVTGAPVGVSG